MRSSRRTDGGSHGSLQTRRPQAGLHPIIFKDPNEGPDAARARTRRFVTGANGSSWRSTANGSKGLSARHHHLQSRFRRLRCSGFGGAVVVGSYLAAATANRSAAPPRRSLAATSGADARRAPRRRVRPARRDAQSYARPDRRPARKSAAGLKRHRARPAHAAGAAAQSARAWRASSQRDAGHASFADAFAQLDEVLSLFAAILRVAEVESGETRRILRACRRDAPCWPNWRRATRPRSRIEGRSFQWSIEPDLSVRGDRELLAQADRST